MKKILMVNPQLCTGCRICELVCSLSRDGECNPLKSCIRVLKLAEEGIDIPGVCQQCETPLCADVCPVDAISRDLYTGALIIREEICVGCRACSMVCPYGAITMDISKRIMIKCDLCGGDPKCVKFCLTKALIYDRPEVVDALRQESALRSLVRPLLKSREKATPTKEKKK